MFLDPSFLMTFPCKYVSTESIESYPRQRRPNSLDIECRFEKISRYSTILVTPMYLGKWL